MRSAIAALIGTAIAALSVPAQAHKCAVVDIEVPASRIDAILDETDRDRRNELMSNLVGYWMVHCSDRRENVSPTVVRQLARLLTAPDKRFAAAMLLVDAGGNLRHARAAVDTALADETARYERNLAANRGLIANHHRLTAMQCLSRKLDTGNVDEDLCGEVLNSRGDE